MQSGACVRLYRKQGYHLINIISNILMKEDNYDDSKLWLPSTGVISYHYSGREK